MAASRSLGVQLPNPPRETVSSLCFEETEGKEILVATSWDWKEEGAAPASGPETCATIAMWDAETKKRMWAFAHSEPLLASCWDTGSPKCLYSAGCRNRAFRYVFSATPKTVTVARHQASISAMHFHPQLKALVTGSWDKTVKLWDPRAPSADRQDENNLRSTLNIDLPERVYSLDIDKGPLMIAALASRLIVAYDLRHPGKPLKTLYSALSFQSRCVKLSGPGFILGSVEGRCALYDWKEPKPFTFKAASDKRHAINAIALKSATVFGTACSDGQVNFWDLAKRSALKSIRTGTDPVTALAMNPKRTKMAYSIGYDWSHGLSGYRSKGSQIVIDVPPAEPRN